VLYAVGALGVFGFASFWAVIGVIAMFAAEEQPILNGVLFLFFGGLIPGSGGALLAWRSVVHFRRISRMRRLTTVLLGGEAQGLEDLMEAMGTTASVVRTTAFEAVHHGILGSEEVLSITSSTGGAKRAGMPAAGPQGQPWPTVGEPSGHASTWAAAGPPVAGAPAAGGSMAPATASTAPPAYHPPSQAPAPSSVIPPSSTPLSAWVGSTLKDTWHVEALLGQGGMGAVFRARHLRTGRRYALKVMLPQAQMTAEALHRFEREATAASSLGHPGLVAVHDFDRTPDGAAYLVMDLLEGETLQQRLERRGMLPWPEAKRITLEAGDALAAAHDAGLLHRDVKPGNVFLARERKGERVVLLDFGLVKRMGSGVVSRVTASGAVVGTPMYMSPEQARGETVDTRSDLYGLAVVAYEMVVGVPPFFDRNQAAVYARLLREPAPRASHVAPESCPPGFDEVVGRALSTRREDRHDGVRTFLGALAMIGGPATKQGRTAII